MFKKVVAPWLLVAAIIVTSLTAFAASGAQTQTARITPGKLIITWSDKTREKTELKTFNFPPGYNVAQLRSMVAALGGIVELLSDGSYQIKETGTPVAFESIGFDEARDVAYKLNVTNIRNIHGNIIKPEQPGWVYLTQYDYNWGSIRDVAEAMDIEVVSYKHDSVNAVTEVVLRRKTPVTTLPEGWLKPEPPGRGGWWYTPKVTEKECDPCETKKATTKKTTEEIETTTKATTTTETTTKATTTTDAPPPPAIDVKASVNDHLNAYSHAPSAAGAQAFRIWIPEAASVNDIRNLMILYTNDKTNEIETYNNLLPDNVRAAGDGWYYVTKPSGSWALQAQHYYTFRVRVDDNVLVTMNIN